MSARYHTLTPLMHYKFRKGSPAEARINERMIQIREKEREVLEIQKIMTERRATITTLGATDFRSARTPSLDFRDKSFYNTN